VNCKVIKVQGVRIKVQGLRIMDYGSGVKDHGLSPSEMGIALHHGEFHGVKIKDYVNAVKFVNMSGLWIK